jgi:hypothetical protein
MPQLPRQPGKIAKVGNHSTSHHESNNKGEPEQIMIQWLLFKLLRRTIIDLVVLCRPMLIPKGALPFLAIIDSVISDIFEQGKTSSWRAINTQMTTASNEAGEATQLSHQM